MHTRVTSRNRFFVLLFTVAILDKILVENLGGNVLAQPRPRKSCLGSEMPPAPCGKYTGGSHTSRTPRRDKKCPSHWPIFRTLGSRFVPNGGYYTQLPMAFVPWRMCSSAQRLWAQHCHIRGILEYRYHRSHVQMPSTLSSASPAPSIPVSYIHYHGLPSYS